MATNGGTGLAAGAMVAGIRGSLPLQVLVFNHRYYVTAAVVISLLAFVYKGEAIVAATRAEAGVAAQG